MDNNVFTFDNPSNSLMDFDYMDELLLDGCWLQATDGSEITNNNPSPSNSIFDPSFQWPNLESNIGKPVSKDLFAPERNSSKSHVKNLTGFPNDESENHSESSKRWWIAPTASSGPSLSVMERLIYAIDNIKHYTVDKNVLIQVWLPEIKDGKKVLSTSQQGGKSGCRHSNENLVYCLSTVDIASYVSDPYFKDFQEACSEHHLFKGQGVVGRAFTTNEPCYSPDVTSYTKTQYPLAHHASYFDLHAAVAIRLRTTYADTVDFVLEFFLPVECKNQEDQKGVVNSLLNIIGKVCRSLRFVTEKELQEEAVNEGLLVVSDIEHVQKIQETTEPGPDPGPGSGTEKRRAGAKMEKSITLEMLRQHFAGSLKDAAKNIGVCPTTLKRICRQHGIQRWPSRKIKKVGHSLRKIQLVMDLVHGGSGSFQIESFYSNFPKLASQDPSTTTQLPFAATKTETFDSKGGNTVISCSQSSSSSHSLSGGTHQAPPVKEDTGDQEQDQDRYQDQDQEQERKLFLGSLNDPPKHQNRPPKPYIKREGGLWRVKVTFGEEKIRFRLQKDWGYNDLLQEIAKRFSLNDIGGYQLRYLDDDSEWVLLTCDADVEECIDVYRSFKSGTIRLALREPQIRVGSSLGSNTPL